MIERACKDDDRLNVSAYIDMLAYEAVSVIVEKIETEKERLAGLSSPAPVEAKEEPELSIGVKVNKDAMKTDFPGLNKTMTIELEYPVDLGDELTRIFGELRRSGVKMRVIKTEEPDIPKF